MPWSLSRLNWPLFRPAAALNLEPEQLRKNGMKIFVLGLILIFATISTLQADAFQDSKKPADIDFEKIDAVEAMVDCEGVK